MCDVKHMKHHNMNEIKHMVMMHYARHILILIKYMTYDKHGILYMMREITGFSHILPILKKHNIAGIKYKNTILFGFEIFMKDVGSLYTSTSSRCFVINRKCQETMSIKKVDFFKPNQF